MSKEGSDGNINVADSVAFMLSPLLNLYKQNIEKMIQSFGISGGQPPLLFLLTEQDGQCQKDLAKQLNVKASSLTDMITRLEKINIIERRKSEDDKRNTRVFLTDKGRQVCKKMSAVVRFINERNLAGFRNEEKILLLRLMEQMYTNLNKQQKELLMLKKEEIENEKND